MKAQGDKSEFSDVECGDRRLESRVPKVAKRLSNNPEAPNNQASEDRASTKAAYHLFDNKKVSAVRILRPHQERTTERMKGEPLVLVVQNTTCLNYSSHESVLGLGPIDDSRSDAQGLIMHSALALTVELLPMGFLALMSVVAWRIFWMTHVQRTKPTAPAATVLTRQELRALPLFLKKPHYLTK